MGLGSAAAGAAIASTSDRVRIVVRAGKMITLCVA
jgi:hypothetical protein